MYTFLILHLKKFFANEQTRVVKKYEGNIGDNVEKILRDVLKGYNRYRDR